MERQGDHRLDARKIDGHRAVVIGGLRGGQFFIVALSAVRAQVFVRLFVGFPNRRKAGRFGRHDVDPDAVIHRERRNAGADKFENFIFEKAALEGRADEGKRDVLRPDALSEFAFEIDGDDLGTGDVVSLPQKLFDDLAAALADRERAERAVARVGIGTEDHFSAARRAFAHILVNDGKMRGNIISAVFFRGGKPEEVVVLIDRSAHGAERIMAVGERIRNGEFFKSACLRRLDNTDVSNIVRSQFVELQFQRSVLFGSVGTQDRTGDRAVHRLFLFFRSHKGVRLFDDLPFEVVRTRFDQFHHIRSVLLRSFLSL